MLLTHTRQITRCPPPPLAVCKRVAPLPFLRTSCDESKGKKQFPKTQLEKAKGKYLRGQRLKVKGVKDKKLKASLKATEERMREAVVSAARAEILLPEEAGFLEPEGPLERRL